MYDESLISVLYTPVEKYFIEILTRSFKYINFVMDTDMFHCEL